MVYDYDYGIIGGGPAGYTAAISLAKKGKRVVLFEKNLLGGTCLNRGCIPTKSLLHSSEIYKNILNSSEYGIEIDIKSFDFSKIAEKRDKTVEKIRKSLELAVKNSGVQIVYHEAKAIDSNTIIADDKYSVGEIIVATGAEPKEIEGLRFDGEFILSSDDVLKLNKLPKSVLIIGSGAIGIEWARIFSNFGVEVSILEMAEHLLPSADIEVSKRIERIFKQKNVKFYLNDKIAKINNQNILLQSGHELTIDFVLVAVGRKPIKSENNDCNCIGDARGEVQLAHYAIKQGVNLANLETLRLDKDLIPSVIYGEPEIAWVGLREQDCDESYKKIVLPITALGKSWCDESIEGFIKLIIKENIIAGAHIISKEASALIHQILIAMQNKVSATQLKDICFAHPTYSEGIYEALNRC